MQLQMYEAKIQTTTSVFLWATSADNALKHMTAKIQDDSDYYGKAVVVGVSEVKDPEGFKTLFHAGGGQ